MKNSLPDPVHIRYILGKEGSIIILHESETGSASSYQNSQQTIYKFPRKTIKFRTRKETRSTQFRESGIWILYITTFGRIRIENNPDESGYGTDLTMLT
jgi:hypothetical protein